MNMDMLIGKAVAKGLAESHERRALLALSEAIDSGNAKTILRGLLEFSRCGYPSVPEFNALTFAALRLEAARAVDDPAALEVAIEILSRASDAAQALIQRRTK